MSNPENVVLLGAGGQARVVCDILLNQAVHTVVAAIDVVKSPEPRFVLGIPVAGDHSSIPGLIANGVTAGFVAIGDNDIRKMRFLELLDLRLKIVNAVHPFSFSSGHVLFGCGVMVGPGVIVGWGSQIGDNVILNSGAVIEHECEIGHHVHVGPRAVVAGGVRIGDSSFIGIGAVVREGVTIGDNVVVGAGTVVLDDVPANAVVVGSPGRVVKMRREDVLW